jgi:formate hydrogenlyase transcriptional activator
MSSGVHGQDARTSLASTDFNSRLIEGSPDCIKVLDLEGRLLSMNAGGMQVLEICDLAPFIGSSWIDFWKGKDQEAARNAVAAARNGKVGRFVGYFPSVQTRKPMWFDVVVSPIKNEQGLVEKLLAASREVTEWKRSDQLLHAIIEGTSAVAGEEFFRSLVQRLAEGLGVRWVFVAECLPNLRARTLAYWKSDRLASNFEYDLRGTPCLKVAEGRTCHVPDRLPDAFPEDKGMIDMGTVSYLGVPLRDTTKRVIGHLVTFDDKPMPPDPLAISVLETFANRAGLEVERMRAFANLHRLNQENEERFRDLFEEAPIAYVHEGLDTRFIRANRTAMRILGIKPHEIQGTYGKTFIPDTPDAQRRIREALESIGKGTDASGVVLELRRKDNGKPIWIQWWSRPDPSGTYTRTMFVDITEQVLMEKEKTRLEAQNIYLQEEIRSEHNFTEIVGNSPALLNVLRQVDQVAPTDSTVLILGETGTGKELIARAIHDRSDRKSYPLVKVNCGAISAGLVESELFGHVKGAFTGALTNRDGRFKLADGGTIFLDEVGELPLDTQVKLLRVLQEQEFEPIGGSRTIKVNVRVIAATNRDLIDAIREGKFRSDLYYRLNVVPMRVPSLRERANDVPLLTTFFMQRFAKKFNKPVNRTSEETMQRLSSYSWPGNIRELQNIIERAVVLSQGNTLALSVDFDSGSRRGEEAEDSRITHLSSEAHLAQVDHASRIDKEEPQTHTPASSPGTSGSLEDVERRHIESVLKQTNWMIEGERGAAKILSLNPSTLRSRMQKLGIKRPARNM